MQFKIGDTVECIDGEKANVSSGWDKGKTFVIAHSCYFPASGGGVFGSALKLINKPMARTFTNSQKIRLRLKTYWDKNETGFPDFEDYYSAFTDAMLDNLEFLAATFDL